MVFVAVVAAALSLGLTGSAAAAPTAHITYVTCNYSTSHPLLQQGSTGASVKQAQCLLNVTDSAGLSVDGIFGSATTAAVKHFQNRFGLSPDGIVGDNTWGKLYQRYDAYVCSHGGPC